MRPCTVGGGGASRLSLRSRHADIFSADSTKMLGFRSHMYEKGCLHGPSIQLAYTPQPKLASSATLLKSLRCWLARGRAMIDELDLT